MANTSTAEAKPMRILEQYEIYCPGCRKNRTVIVPGGKGYKDVKPCPTCRPQDHADWTAKQNRSKKR